MVKKMMSEAPVPRYYYHNKPLAIQCDASEKALGATLPQEGKLLAYTSWDLNDTEIWYARIEKELLAVVYACECLYQ